MIERLLLPTPSPHICTIALLHRVVHTRQNDWKMLLFLWTCGDAILKEENGHKLKPLLHQRGNNFGISCQAQFCNVVLLDCQGGILIIKPVELKHVKNQRNEMNTEGVGLEALLFEGSKNNISISNYTLGKKLSVLIMFLEAEILYFVVGT